jgi:hypothetical protein
MVEIPTVPMTLYHPVHGAVTVATLEDAARVFQPEHNWVKTPQEADAHRTQREAAMVIHKGVRAQVALHEEGDQGVVKHSVTHQDDIDRKVEGVAIEAEATGAPVPETKDETKGAELLA